MLESQWWNGPPWLKENSENWPVNDIFCESKEVDIERKKVKLSNANLSEVSTPCETDNAEKFWIQRVQKCYFPDIKCINSIDVFLDDGVNIRVKIRITKRKDIPSFLAPYLLPANLRERFWICKSRRTIRSVVNKCTKCRRYKAEPMRFEPTPLPADRVENSTVFEVTGIDLAGPLFLKNGEKRYLAKNIWRQKTPVGPPRILPEIQSSHSPLVGMLGGETCLGHQRTA
ncbi:integrase_H2C2 domain-containing protein [Trichonephila clavipes]|nr:integrase_H2C2 domain-containing protein [Trichonephila clavipes]